ncbi:TPA: CvpA family protein [Bacillus paranthracis]|nr:CvpA family protein [Bacillus paranthracis]
MKKYITWSQFFVAVAAFLAVPIVINFIAILIGMFFKSGDVQDWLGFFGNYSGGFLGVVIAFVIAKQQGREQDENLRKQLENQRKLELEKEHRQRKFAQLPALIAIQYELQALLDSLHVLLLTRESEYQVELNGGDSQTLDLVVHDCKPYKIRELNKDIFSYIQLIDVVDLQAELYLQFSQYKEFAEALKQEIDIEIIESIAKAVETWGSDMKRLMLEDRTGSVESLKAKFWLLNQDNRYVNELVTLRAKISDEIEATKELRN